jgi:D-alanyl-D-alanine carboxypeptidase
MNRFPGLITFFAVCTLLVTGCQGHTSMAENMAEPFQETIDEQRQRLNIPGISAAVILPDGTTWLGASGKSSDGQAMDSGMLFGLASVSKTYTAALVVQLAAEGLLSVDDPIGKWIPDLGRINRNIPLRLLLNHTSGLYRYQQEPEFLAAVSAQPERIWKPWEIVQEFQGEPECQPGQCSGESFGESAMDYVLLGMVIEKATGSAVSSQLAGHFFEPLGLENTFLYPEQVYPIENMAHMWWDINGSGQPVDVTASIGPQAALWSGLWTSGAVHATAEDLARFTKSLFEGKLISPNALNEMLTPGIELSPDTHYGYSVVIEKIDGRMVYWHTGGAGYSSVYFYVPEDGTSIAVLGNLMVDLKPTALALYEAHMEHQR